MIDYCEEYGEIIAVVPIPAGQCQHSIPFGVPSPSVSAADITLSAVGTSSSDPYYAPPSHPSYASLFSRSGFFVDGYDSRASANTIITIQPRPSVKGSAKRSIDGLSYTVKVSCNTEEDIDVVHRFVNQMSQHEYFDLFLVDTNERCYLVRGVFPASQIQFDQQLPVYNRGEVSFEFHCVNGLQPIVE